MGVFAGDAITPHAREIADGARFTPLGMLSKRLGAGASSRAGVLYARGAPGVVRDVHPGIAAVCPRPHCPRASVTRSVAAVGHE